MPDIESIVGRTLADRGRLLRKFIREVLDEPEVVFEVLYEDRHIFLNKHSEEKPGTFLADVCLLLESLNTDNVDYKRFVVADDDTVWVVFDTATALTRDLVIASGIISEIFNSYKNTPLYYRIVGNETWIGGQEVDVPDLSA